MRRRVLTLTDEILLEVVDRFFTSQNADEEDDRELCSQHSDDRRQPPEHRTHTRHVDVHAIDEFLEHLDVIALFGHLVQAVPELRRLVG